MKLQFNVRGNRKQYIAIKAWINDDIKEILYGGGKGGAKSWTGVSLIFGDAFMYTNTRYFIARKTLKDLTSFTNGTIQKVFNNWGIKDGMAKFDGKNNIWKLHNGSKVFFLDAKFEPSDPKYDRFGSMEMTRGWVEEAGEFERECVNSLGNSLGRWRNKETGLKPKLLLTANPSKNFLYKDYYLPHVNGTLKKSKIFIQALVGDNKSLGEDYAKDMIERMQGDDSAIQRLVYGNWEFDDNANVLIKDYSKIVGLYSNTYVEKTNQRYITADIAYEGSDIFAIGIWNGFVLEKIIAIDKIKQTRVSAKINELRLHYKIPISNVIYDADGVRTFVRESSKDGFLRGATQFRNGARAYGKENYANLKTQCYFKLAEYINNGLIYIEDETYSKEVLKELSNIRKLPLNDDGKIKLEKKSDYRNRNDGSSYDFADMLMMRMVTEVKRYQPFTVKWN